MAHPEERISETITSEVIRTCCDASFFIGISFMGFRTRPFYTNVGLTAMATNSGWYRRQNQRGYNDSRCFLGPAYSLVPSYLSWYSCKFPFSTVLRRIPGGAFCVTLQEILSGWPL